jgi:hypothetical protein
LHHLRCQVNQGGFVANSPQSVGEAVANSGDVNADRCGDAEDQFWEVNGVEIFHFESLTFAIVMIG